jgi:hypothetical protein
VILTNPQPHIGKIYHLTGPQSENMHFYAREYSKALGRNIIYEDIPVIYEDIPVEPWRDELLKLGLPVHLVNHLPTLADLHRAGRFDRISDEVLTLTGQRPLSMQESSGIMRRHSPHQQKWLERHRYDESELFIDRLLPYVERLYSIKNHSLVLFDRGDEIARGWSRGDSISAGIRQAHRRALSLIRADCNEHARTAATSDGRPEGRHVYPAALNRSKCWLAALRMLGVSVCSCNFGYKL